MCASRYSERVGSGGPSAAGAGLVAAHAAPYPAASSGCFWRPGSRIALRYSCRPSTLRGSGGRPPVGLRGGWEAAGSNLKTTNGWLKPQPTDHGFGRFSAPCSCRGATQRATTSDWVSPRFGGTEWKTETDHSGVHFLFPNTDSISSDPCFLLRGEETQLPFALPAEGRMRPYGPSSPLRQASGWLD